MAENSSMLFTSYFLMQELVIIHAKEKHCPFFLTASWQGTRGGRRLQQRWHKHDGNDGDDGDGRGRGEKKTVVGGGSCTQMKPCIEALAARCCCIVEGQGTGMEGQCGVAGEGGGCGGGPTSSAHLGGILLMASMVAGAMGSTSILGR